MSNRKDMTRIYGMLGIGLTLFWPNLQHSFFRMTFTGRLGEHSLLFYGISLAFIALCCLLFTWGHQRARKMFARHPRIVSLVAIVALVSSALIVAFAPELSSGSFRATLFAATVTAAWSCALCTILFAWLSLLECFMFELDMRKVVGIAVLSGVAGFFLIPVMLFHSSYYQTMALASLGLSGIAWSICQRMAPQAFSNGIKTEDQSLTFSSLHHWGTLFAAYLLASILHAIFYALDASIDLEMYGMPCYAIVGTFGLILGLSTMPVPRSLIANRRFQSSYATGITMTIGLFAGLFLALVLFDLGNWSANLNFISAANRCLQILIFMSLLVLVYQQKVSSIAVFSLLFLSVEVLSNLICYFIAPALISHFALDVASFAGAFASVVGGLLIIVLVLSLIVFAQSDGMRVIAFELPHQNTEDDGGGQAFNRASLCAAIASTYGLTNREQDVLFYLSQGYSAKKIAETLFVSFETVRSHTGGIYRKMGVHSKQQLIDRVVTIESEMR